MRTLLISAMTTKESNPPPIRELSQAEINSVSGGFYRGVLGDETFEFIPGGGDSVTVVKDGVKVGTGWSEDGDSFNINYDGRNLEINYMGNDMFSVTLDGVGINCIYVGR